jgi:alkaline phosphatase
MASRSRQLVTGVLVTVAVIGLALVVFSLFGGHEFAIGNLVLRAQTGTSYPLTSPHPSALVAKTPSAFAEVTSIESRPKNVIVIIGDGMGVGIVSAASALLNGPGSALALTETPFLGLMSTWATNNLSPDSASTATSMATGFKTRTNAIGVLEDGRVVRNLFEAARERGLATGVVTTSALADATPAGFLAHTDSRNDYDIILEKIIASRTDVLIGGDWSGRQKARRNDRYMELVENAEITGAEHGYTVIRDPEALETATTPLLALFPPRSAEPLQHGPPLAQTTRQALKLLWESPEGFLLLVECELIDEAAHDNDIARVMEGMRELDDAVAVALELSAYRGDTLVVVAADHDTGGLGLFEGDYSEGKALARWAHDYHLSNFVPVFAFGPGARSFTGVFDNTAFGPKIAHLLGLAPLPQLAPKVADSPTN